MAEPESPPPPVPSSARTRRTAVRYTNLEKVNSSPILTKPNRVCHMETPMIVLDGGAVAQLGSMQGWRKTMEDRHSLTDLGRNVHDGVLLIAVFDGHRGIETAQHLSELVPEAIIEILREGQEGIESRASEIFCRVDENIRRRWMSGTPRPPQSPASSATLSPTSAAEPQVDHLSLSTLTVPSPIANPITGSTANVVVVLAQTYVFFNVGDSRSYLVRHRGNIDSEAIDVVALSSASESDRVAMPTGMSVMATSVDHRPTNDAEAKRVAACGGEVVRGRVNGKLSVSRAFGDFDLKPHIDEAHKNPVTCLPDVLLVSRLDNPVREGPDAHGLPQDYDLIIVGCDGVWELQTAEAIAARFHDKLDALRKTLEARDEHEEHSEPSATANPIASIIADVIRETLQHACATSSDPSGGTPGSDNMTLGLAVIFR